MALADFNKKTEKGLVTGGWKLAFHSLCSGEEKSRLVIQRLHDANHLPLEKKNNGWLMAKARKGSFEG